MGTDVPCASVETGNTSCSAKNGISRATISPQGATGGEPISCGAPQLRSSKPGTFQPTGSRRASKISGKSVW